MQTDKLPGIEQCLIAQILKNPSCLDDVAELITAQDFSSPRHAGIYRAIGELSSKGELIEVLSVAELRPNDFEYLTDLVTDALDVGAVTSAKRIAKAAAKREALEKLSAATQAIMSGNDFDHDINTAQQILNTIERDHEQEVTFKDALKQGVSDLERRFNGEAPKGTATGFSSLDERYTGFQPADFVIIAGRPAMGKTTLAMNILWNIACTGKEVLFFSLEMSRQQIIDRMMASVSGIHFNKIKSGKLVDGDWDGLQAGISRMLDKKIHIIDKAAMNINHIAAISRKFARRGDIGAVCVDYLQLCRVDSKSRFDEVSEVSRSLKAIAKTIEAPVIALSQLSRDVEKRTNKRPVNSDLRESGQLEQDADIIMFLYRDEVYNPGTNDVGVCEVITTKFRNGEIGTDYIKSELDRVRFVDMPTGYAPPPTQTGVGFYAD